MREYLEKHKKMYQILFKNSFHFKITSNFKNPRQTFKPDSQRPPLVRHIYSRARTKGEATITASLFSNWNHIKFQNPTQTFKQCPPLLRHVCSRVRIKGEATIIASLLLSNWNRIKFQNLTQTFKPDNQHPLLVRHVCSRIKG